MKTDRLWIGSAVQRSADAEELVREFADKTGITGRDYLHLSLLTEETLGMAHQMLRDFRGEIWLEGTPEGYMIVLEAEVRRDGAEAAAGPESPEGFMAKVAEMMNCSYVFENAGEIPDRLARMLPEYISGGIREADAGTVWAGRWSLSAYREYLQHRQGSGDAEIALDELEKSIVARIAEDVTIGIQGNRIRLAITGRAA